MIASVATDAGCTGVGGRNEVTPSIRSSDQPCTSDQMSSTLLQGLRVFGATRTAHHDGRGDQSAEATGGGVQRPMLRTWRHTHRYRPPLAHLLPRLPVS